MEARVLSVTNIRGHPTYSVEVTRATDGLQRQLLYRFSAFRALRAICLPSERLKHLPFPKTPAKQTSRNSLSPAFLEQRRQVLDRWLSGAVAAAATLEPPDRAALFEFLHVQLEEDDDDDDPDEPYSSGLEEIPDKFYRGGALRRSVEHVPGSSSGLHTTPLRQGDLRCIVFRLNCLGGGAGHLDRPFDAYLVLSYMSINIFKRHSKEQQSSADNSALHPCYQSTLGGHEWSGDNSNDESKRKFDKLVASIALNDLMAVRLIEKDSSTSCCTLSIQVDPLHTSLHSPLVFKLMNQLISYINHKHH